MKISRAIILWLVVIVALLLLEVAQVTHLFTLGFASILGNVVSFVFALLLVTILALVGAIFVGIFIAHRILSPQGFSPFEEEMLKMRQEVQDLHRKVDRLGTDGADPPAGTGGHAGPRPSAPSPSSRGPSTAEDRP